MVARAGLVRPPGAAVLEVDRQRQRSGALCLFVGVSSAGAASGRGSPSSRCARSRADPASAGRRPRRARARAPRARPSAPTARNTSGSVVGTHQAVLEHAGVELAQALLPQVAQRPVAPRSRPGIRWRGIGGIERRDDREQRVSRGLNGAASAAVRPWRAQATICHWLTRSTSAAAAARWACVLRDADARVRQCARAHAHLHARREAGLAAVDAGHREAREPAAPVAVGEDHGLGNDQIQWRAGRRGAISTASSPAARHRPTRDESCSRAG